MRAASDENAALAGKLGAIQTILSGIERHATVATVAEEGFWALKNICANGSPLTDYKNTGKRGHHKTG